ncbi:unnamed protein product [Linum tenue]|uniref:Expansin-like CBD domain-containing protein n=1 Tax=Linum tenue TaxID=586396 RepID=A0AAV0K6N4_9ROSI|nr:unnamed protein product [Linum tenue]
MAGCALAYGFGLVVAMLLPGLSIGDDFVCTRATYYGSPDCLGTPIDVEYKRIPCRYAGYNIVVKVKEHSKYPDYLAVVLLYQAGQYDVAAVEIWQEDCKQWRGMRRAYGAVFDVVTPPKGELKLRFQLASSVETTWVESKSVIPGEWKAGATYDSNVQLN